jgi:hypothetical protein
VSPASAARVENIGPQGRRRRVLSGAVMLGIGAVVLAALVLTGGDRGWRAVLFVPFWAGALGVFQARGGT